jgi:ribonuclease P protein component
MRRRTSSRRSAPGRLSRSADFERAYRRGQSAGNRYLVVYVFPREAGDQPRLGVSVSRRLGGAVVRNRVKRLLREAFRAAPDLAAGRDYVAVARPDAADLAEREGLAGIQRALGELLRATAQGRPDGVDEVHAEGSREAPA